VTPPTAARLVLGAAGCLRPRLAYRWWSGGPASDLELLTVRVLAVRHVVQAVVTTVHPTRRTEIGGVLVDGLHGLTMVLLAVASRRYRRPATVSAAVAAGLATAATARLRGAAHTGATGTGRAVVVRWPTAVDTSI
jgi:hypothetical protein